MPPADPERALYDAANALAVALARVDLLRRRLDRIAADRDALDAELTRVRAALDRLRVDLGAITKATIGGDGNRGTGGDSG